MDYLIPPEELRTAGFVLRSYHPGDGSLLHEALDGSYEHLAPFMPWAKPETTVAEAEVRSRINRGEWLTARDFTLAIVATDGSKLLGSSGFHLRQGPLHTRCAEIGMWIRAGAAGQGLGSAVLGALLAWGFDAWGWQRLAWTTDARNRASIRTAEKAGMSREGTLLRLPHGPHHEIRDQVCFAAHRDHWVRPTSM